MNFLFKKDPLNVLEKTLPYVQSAKYVKINGQKLDGLCSMVEKRIAEGLPDGGEEFHRFGDVKKDVQLVFLENVVNFCFWAENGDEKWKVSYKGRIEDGATALGLAFERALAEGVPILEASFLKNLSLAKVKEIFRPSNGVEMPLLNERHKNLVEAGAVLDSKYDGKYYNLLSQCQYDALEIVKETFKNFTSFNDSYAGVNFYKRAQLNAFDIDQISGISLKNVDLLTAMADYKLPQLLRAIGVLEYSEALAKKVDNFTLIKQGSQEELEIRSATIWAIEQVSQELNISPGLADRAIWWLSREVDIKEPYHRTYSIYY